MRTPAALQLPALAMAGCDAVVPLIRMQCRHENAVSENDIGCCGAIRVVNTLIGSGTAGPGVMPSAVRSVCGRLQLIIEENGFGQADVVG
jgi:hypothetical protein